MRIIAPAEVTVRTWAIITALVFATLDRPLAEVADDFNPSFLQAAIFFVMGREPPKDVKFDSDRLAIVLSVITDQMGAHDAKHEFNVSKQEPCTINMTLLEPPYGMGRLEFMKLPSPRAMRITGENVHMDLPPETWCNSKAEVNSEGFVQSIKGTSMCLRKVQLVGHVFRRLAALDYIRDHFCAGQPEPPPPPRKPY